MVKATAVLAALIPASALGMFPGSKVVSVVLSSDSSSDLNRLFSIPGGSDANGKTLDTFTTKSNSSTCEAHGEIGDVHETLLAKEGDGSFPFWSGTMDDGDHNMGNSEHDPNATILESADAHQTAVEAQANSVLAGLVELIAKARRAATGQLTFAEDLHSAFRVGDAEAASQMALAQRSANKLLAAVTEADRTRVELERSLERGASGAMLGEVEAATLAAQDAFQQLSALHMQSNPGVDSYSVSDREPVVSRYSPAMSFVIKAYKDLPMTCSGPVLEEPIYSVNFDGCAAACDLHAEECVGFAYYPTASHGPNLCFLLSGFESGRYYTGCKSESLWKSDPTSEPQHPVCMAKQSKFSGNALRPQEEGACKDCFSDIQRAGRCWQ